MNKNGWRHFRDDRTIESGGKLGADAGNKGLECRLPSGLWHLLESA